LDAWLLWLNTCVKASAGAASREETRNCLRCIKGYLSSKDKVNYQQAGGKKATKK
jgi:hypothetical protein